MTLLASLIWLQVAMAADIPSGKETGAECVVLLHGMARTARSMQPMAEALAEVGYTVANTAYPSREHRIEELAPLAVDAGLSECRRQGNVKTVHFVTHSLGGILLRYYLASKAIPQLGRVVMLGPPNQGSGAADRWRGFPGFDWLNGPAGRQLGKGSNSVPLQLGKATFELGVIAGDRSIDPITSLLLDGPDDGRVAVADTRLDGMQDFRLVHATHAFMMRNDNVIALTKTFLLSGSFDMSSVH